MVGLTCHEEDGEVHEESARSFYDDQQETLVERHYCAGVTRLKHTYGSVPDVIEESHASGIHALRIVFSLEDLEFWITQKK